MTIGWGQWRPIKDFLVLLPLDGNICMFGITIAHLPWCLDILIFSLNFSSLSTSLFDINNPSDCPQTAGDSQTEYNSNWEQRQLKDRISSILTSMKNLTLPLLVCIQREFWLSYNFSINQSFILLSSHHYDFLRTKGPKTNTILEHIIGTSNGCLRAKRNNLQ